MKTLTHKEIGRSLQNTESAIREKVAAMVGVAAADIDPREPLHRYGVTSAQALELMAYLSERAGQALAPTLVWEHPSAGALARRIAEGPKTSAQVRREAAAASSEPIAIIGIGCRFPGGADNPRAYWRLLRDGVDAVGEPPAGRAELDGFFDPDPGRPGTTHVRRGGFLDRVDGFDPQFFGISPREAEHMDPQQRLALELAWETLEDAAIHPEQLRGSRTGVFMGVGWHDYADLLKGHPEAITPYTGTGQTTCVIPNRMSYVFGLRGPSIGVDTACSSSLVAVHLACQSLRCGESTLALAGGVNLALHPETWVALAKFGGLAADGVCRAFAEGASGFVRGEGGGAVLLKPLSRALADGDTVYCVIRGSAINNDGASNGLTAPNPAAQEEMLRDAYTVAGVDPAQVHYVETHGTGTALGDPIEASALGEVLGQGRDPERPLLIGSVKTNLGHLEIAAGVAGLIKAALALQHRQIPPSLHFKKPNPLIPFAALRLRVASALTPWPAREDEVARAGVSAFGWGGTNCHLVLEGAEASQAQILALAAESREGLHAAAAVLRARAADPAAPRLLDMCRESSQSENGRHRLAITAHTRAELVEKLDAFLEGRNVAGLVSGEAAARPPRLAFVFSPEGAQWDGMGRELMRLEPTFRAALAASDAAIQRQAGWSLLEEMTSEVPAVRGYQIDRAQPVTIAYELALVALWKAWGIAADVLVGPSLGDFAAVHAAGVLDLDETMRVVCEFAALERPVADRGSMAALELPREQVALLLLPELGRIWLAGQTGPQTFLITGEIEALDRVIATARAAGAFAARIQIHVAAHCPHFEPIREALPGRLRGLRPQAPRVPLLSAWAGRYVDGPDMDGEYFAQMVRREVRFEPAIQQLLDEGVECFVEISPHPILRHTIQQSVAASGRSARVIASARRNDEYAAMLDALGALFVAGAEPRWESVHRGVNAASAPAAQRLAPAPAQQALELLPLSARGPAALAEQARRWVDFLEHDGAGLRDIAYTAQLRRSHQPHRLALVGRSAAELVAQLRAVDEAELAPALSRPPRLVFVFPGYGAQWFGMGRRLAATEPVFRRALVACDAALSRYVDFSVLAELHADADHTRQGETHVGQVLTFALQVALAGLLQHWGLVPAAVVGHSMGEVAAAYVAGALSLEHAAQVIAVRNAIVREQASQRGGMWMVGTDVATAKDLVAGYVGRVSVAVVNAPRMLVLSGDLEPLAAIAGQLQASGVFCRRVNVDYASHSPHMDPLLPLLREALSGVEARAADIPFCSTVSAEFEAGQRLDAGYWAHNLRSPVQFAPAIERLSASHDIFVEISTHPLLTTAIEETLRERGATGEAVALLRRDEDEALNIRRAVARLHERGCAIDFAAMHPSGGRPVPLPTYAWQRERYWVELGDSPARPAPLEASRGDVPVAAGSSSPRAPTRSDAAASTSLGDRLAAAPASARPRMLEDHVRSRVARILGLRAHHALDHESGFAELGLSSLMALELRNAISTDIGRPLSATLAFDYPTVRALSAHLRGLLALDSAPAAVKPGPAAQPDGGPGPIAVVGIGCRLPGGVDDTESFWKLLCAGVDATREVPPDRWQADALYDPDAAAPRKMYVRRGAFLDQVEGFDAAFFRISPREAQKLDPQQRLLLEVAWEALEDANLPLDPLVGSDTGVFLAAGPSEYRSRLAAAGLDGQDAYGLTGNLSCSLSGRISYVFGFQGPTMTLDTGCSSSLVALHLACQSLRSGETELALAGGVNLIIDPETTIDLCKSSALAPDGRCKTFSTGADGYARGEGCGLVVLKRLSDARRDGDRVLAVIHGTAVNHGGRAAGLTVPSGPAQEALMRKALRQVAVDPAEVGFVETHGTGTHLGDPIEVGALAAVYGRASGRRSPCALGALKTNVGHLELAAGIAGFIKAVLCVRHGEIPANVRLGELNPKLPLEGAALSFPTERQSWPERYARRIAAVSSFGMGGTNAHIVVEQAPEEPVRAPAEAHAGPVLVPLSARDPSALRVMAERYRMRLVSGGAQSDLVDVAYTAALRRAHHSRRIAVVAQHAEEAAELLQAWLHGEARTAVVAGHDAPGQRRLAFVFSGQGSQWVGMGRQLYAQDAAFRAAMDACDAAIRRAGGVVLVELLHADDLAARLREPEVLQPALFAVQVALSAALGARGVAPDAVVGHSVGEIAAAHVAGALSLDEAAQIVCMRSRLIRMHATGRGGMAQIDLSVEEVERVIGGFAGRLTVAISNAPCAMVLAGDIEALDELLVELERRDIGARRVKVDFAFHGPQMDQAAAFLRRGLELRPGVATTALFSTVTGRQVDGADLGAAYWADNLRQPVRFSHAIAALAEDGVDVFLEISPHPVLVQSIADTLAHHGREGVTRGSLRRDGDESAALLVAIGGLYTAGCALDWAKLAPAGRPVQLPAYPWQRRRYWIDHRPGRELRPEQAAEPGIYTTELPERNDRPATPGDGWLRTLLAQADREHRRGLLAGHLREQLAGVLGISAAEIEPRTPLPMIGLDSLMGTELRRRLERSLGRPLSPTLILRNPTLDALTAHIADLDDHTHGDRNKDTQSATPGAWVVVPRPEPGARLQLVCFHYAGGGASMYRDWPALLGPQVEVCAVQLPGREERIDEPALTRMEPLLDALVAELVPRLRGPFVCFGHSMGALVAVELARRLAAEGRPGPAHLFVSGCAGPAGYVPGEALHGLGDAEFRAALRRHGGTPEAVLRDEGLMALLVPLLRADFGVAERWAYRSGPALGCSITGFAGELDPIAGPEQVQAFATETTGRFDLRRFPGDHFFVHSARAAVVAVVRAELVRSGLIGEGLLGEPAPRLHHEIGARV
jgi:acyl transferase domain-containing protein/surfactin synthase thioesterase subunit